MTYIKRELTYPSKVNNRQIRAYVFAPQNGQIKGAVQIVHGMREYILRYEPFISFLCGHGYLVFGNDHLGHGEEAKATKTLGFIKDAKAFDPLERDTYALFKMIKSEYPRLPFFMIGHSMGSFVARIFATRHKEEIRGLVLSGTAGDNPATLFGPALCSVAGLASGDKKPSPFLDSIFFSGYNKRVKNKKSQYDWLSRDEAVVSKYESDPLCDFLFTPPAFRALSDLVAYSNDPVWFDSLSKDLPILLISGSEDPVGAYGKGVKKLYNRLKKAGCVNTELKLYDGGRHEMLNELNKIEVYHDILSYLDRLL